MNDKSSQGQLSGHARVQTKRMQYCCSHMGTKDMLKMFDGIQTSFNVIQHGGQASTTCWTILHQHVASAPLKLRI